MSRWVGKCEYYAPSKVGTRCPQRSGAKISEKCLGWREDCGCYQGTTAPSRQNCGGGHTQAEWERKTNMC